jgi:four helix bundle protein
VRNIYQVTNGFPADEQFGLTSQMRRAAVSIVTNIVEGCARSTEPEYLRFLDIAYGSARELEYQLELSRDLGYLHRESANEIHNQCSRTAKLLCNLSIAIRKRTH